MANRYQFDAYAAHSALRERFADFLLDTYGIPEGELHTRLRENWTAGGSDPERLFAPMIVQGAFPFAPGRTLEELDSHGAPTNERPLHPRTVHLLRNAGITYRLYEHQVTAIQQAALGQTVVLAAGTGSGKTESFLIPLIDQLFWAHERGDDDLAQPGVRALVVYPLNALVNNQVDRILGLLRGQSEIRFAFYTSRLKNTRTQAERSYQSRGREVPPSCQIIDRRALRGLETQPHLPHGPPHILVTNFSMLEYMLIRPADRTVFAAEHLFYRRQPRLKALVLDEAHVYAGAQAAEIHMLLRRTAQRFGTRLEELQGFATSATLESEGHGDPIQEFAARMFSKLPSRVASIVGKRHLPTLPEGPLSKASPTLPPLGQELVPPQLRTLEFDSDGRPVGLVDDEGLADLAWGAIVTMGLARTRPETSKPGRLLFEALSGNERIRQLRSWLGQEGVLPTLDEVAERLYGEEPGDRHRRGADSILRLCSLARSAAGAHPLIPARMHAFVRSPVGAWVDAIPDGWAWGRVSSNPPTDPERQLEIRACTTCGSPYALAYRVQDIWANKRSEDRPERTPNKSASTVTPMATKNSRPNGGAGALSFETSSATVDASSFTVSSATTRTRDSHRFV